MLPVGIIEFSEWLRGELETRQMSQADLVRLSGISAAHVSRVINMQSPPGPEFCRGVAAALELPEEVVFREAGLLSPKGEVVESPTFLEWMHMFLTASEEEQERMLEMARVMREANRRARRGKRDTQEG